MSWNHRVVKRTLQHHDGTKYNEYAIHEAYYDDAGKVWSITENGMSLHGETLEELTEDLERMKKCLEHPILDYDNIPEDGAVTPY